MKFLCRIGIHKWKRQRTIEWRFEYGGELFFEGDVCQKCGQHRVDPSKYTMELPQNYIILGIKEEEDES